MKILQQFALCGSCDCSCPSINETDNNSFLIGGNKTNSPNQVALPLDEYLNAVQQMQTPALPEYTGNVEISGNMIIFSGRPLEASEIPLLAKSLSKDEAGIEVSATDFWSIYPAIRKVTTAA